MAARYAFRDAFQLSARETIQWYPGHMDKSFARMQNKLRQVDCIIEVHDARIPFSGRNPNFMRRLIGPKPYILALNKRDLIDRQTLSAIEKKIKSDGEQYVFTNSKDQSCRGLKQLVPRVIDMVSASDRYHRSEDQRLRLMVIGVPNVGKSSLINALRNRTLHKGKAVAVGAKAGITKAVQNEVRIHLDPPIYLVDTPGILPPRIDDVEAGMNLALCACLNDDVVGLRQIADYLLYWCNKNRNLQYVQRFGLDGPSDNIDHVLTQIAIKGGMNKRVKDISNNSFMVIPDFHTAAATVVRAFRSGQLGPICLDLPYT